MYFYFLWYRSMFLFSQYTLAYHLSTKSNCVSAFSVRLLFVCVNDQNFAQSTTLCSVRVCVWDSRSSLNLFDYHFVFVVYFDFWKNCIDYSDISTHSFVFSVGEWMRERLFVRPSFFVCLFVIRVSNVLIWFVCISNVFNCSVKCILFGLFFLFNWYE